MTHPSDPDPGRYSRLHLTKRLRNKHRRARRAGDTALNLKPWARKLAEGVTSDEQNTPADTLDRKLKLTPAALAWHWITSRRTQA